eukprot:COSAG02_NODE_728_length_17995_cov_52.042244_6_plen_204_part_00
MVGSVLRVCFALTLAIFMLAEWLVCRLLTLCPCISERTRQGCALVSCRVCWSGALLLAPWIWITGEPGEDEVWAEILKQLESDDPRPVFLLGNHTSFMDTFVSVGKHSDPALGSARELHAPDLATAACSKNAHSRRLSVTHLRGGLLAQHADPGHNHPVYGALPGRIQGQVRRRLLGGQRKDGTDTDACGQPHSIWRHVVLLS